MAELVASAAWPAGVLLQGATTTPSQPLDASMTVASLERCVGGGDLPLSILLSQPSGSEPAVGLPWREALTRLNWPYAVLTGDPSQQVKGALQVVQHAWVRARQAPEAAKAPRWRWVCADCDDGDCEQHWLPDAGD